MTREPTLDRPDLELAWSDMEAQSDLYRPSVFWRGASEVLLAEVRAHGVEGFRASKTALGFFVPTYGPPTNGWSPETVDALEAWHAGLGTTTAKQRLTLTHLLRGGAQALADYRVLAAAEDPSRLPRLDRFSESTFGKPVEQFELEGRRFSRSSLNYLLGLSFLKKHLDGEVPRVVLEIGGGFGTLGEIMAASGIPHFRYVNLDIPPMHFVAQQYLSAVMGDENVSSYASTRHLEEIPLESLRPLSALCPWQLPRLRGTLDLFVNFISFQEMEPDIVLNYLAEVDRLGAKHVLLRNLREGKQVRRSGSDLGVETPIVASDYDRFLPRYALVATNVHPFGHRTVDGFHSELRLYRRRS
jgi:putative sugar O-methyltransferase